MKRVMQEKQQGQCEKSNATIEEQQSSRRKIM
jgi:hypothetical protein